MPLAKLFFYLTLFFTYGISTAQAEETDQYSLPPRELQDIGPATSRQLYDVLEQVMAQTNTEIQALLSKAQTSRHAAAKLAARRKDTYLIDLFYKKSGPGFPRWLHWNEMPNENKPKLYKESRPWKTIYWMYFSQTPIILFLLTPTINMYDHHFGTDKLGHFFMQGHSYYKVYTYFINHGKTPEQAHKNMITYGTLLEITYLGVMASGIYSNGDLSANYAGWKFYMNIGHSIKIGDKTLPPLLILKDNKWQFARKLNKDSLLKPYISDHLNEAFNPCRYSYMHKRLLKQIKMRCDDWIKHKGLTKQLVEAKLKETSSWHGEEYGHWLEPNTPISLNSCFAEGYTA